jgi:hypothetical protein
VSIPPARFDQRVERKARQLERHPAPAPLQKMDDAEVKAQECGGDHSRTGELRDRHAMIGIDNLVFEK